MGLSGLSLDSRVRKAFYALPSEVLANLIRQMTVESRRRRLIYQRDGVEEIIRVLARPTGVMPDQLAYLHFVTLTILNALKRLPEMYLADPEVRAVVPLTEAEDHWLRDAWGPSQRDNNPVIGRLDGVIEFTSPMWKDSLRLIEPNLSGVGGIHLCPTAEQLLIDLVLPVLQRHDPKLVMERGQDMRELFIQELVDHLEAIGRKGHHVCFIEPKYSGTGIDEQAPLAEYYLQRHGLKIMHADPAELYIRDGEVWYEDSPVDIAYRDYEVRDLIALEREEGVNIEPLRMLFRENRIISSLAGDFDHKSAWEILTDPRFGKYFNPDERQVFRRHILWTRLVFDRRTMLPDGSTGDLLEFVRDEREILVLKPNRSYGGDRVVLGHLVNQPEWEAEIELALADPTNPWVVQRLAAIPVSECPVLDGDGDVHVEPFYLVMGFAPTKFGVAILGRASQKQVVNVAQRGGMCAVLIGRPVGRLIGPDAVG
ncbi:MAG TPA: hypothetical protein VG056_09525 [Pirellulales bacterium]|nr:hypothetical protein [Pirellulales bacterium]